VTESGSHKGTEVQQLQKVLSSFTATSLQQRYKHL